MSLRKYIQARRPQTMSFGLMDDHPKHDIEIVTKFLLVLIDFN
jgi:hypothetical protein